MVTFKDGSITVRVLPLVHPLLGCRPPRTAAKVLPKVDRPTAAAPATPKPATKVQKRIAPILVGSADDRVKKTFGEAKEHSVNKPPRGWGRGNWSITEDDIDFILTKHPPKAESEDLVP